MTQEEYNEIFSQYPLYKEDWINAGSILPFWKDEWGYSVFGRVGEVDGKSDFDFIIELLKNSG